MDEPTGNLDQDNSRAIMQLVAGIIKADVVTFVVPTDVLEIARETPSGLFLKVGW
jgi:ABC-type lipoprotein export system ATPase subunit